MLGRVEEILISWKKDWYHFGRTRNFKEVYFKDLEEKVNIWEIVKIKITELDNFVLKGELV